MTTPYAKPWLSIPDQLQKLKDYGLVVGDEAAARDFLRHLNYYRFSGYGLAIHSWRCVDGDLKGGPARSRAGRGRWPRA